MLSHSLTVLSAPAEASRLPPRSQARPKQPPVWAAYHRNNIWKYNKTLKTRTAMIPKHASKVPVANIASSKR